MNVSDLADTVQYAVVEEVFRLFTLVKVVKYSISSKGPAFKMLHIVEETFKTASHEIFRLLGKYCT